MSGGKSGSEAKAYRYHMSLHTGLCVGPLDEITQIDLGDRTIWSGSIKQSATYNILDLELFGGDKKEGGVDGAFTVLFGDDHQAIPAALKVKLGDLSDKMPDYRGMTSIFFHERVKDEYDGILLKEWNDLAVFSDMEQVGVTVPVWTPLGGLTVLRHFLSESVSTTIRKGFNFQANNPYLRKLKVRGRRAAKGLDRRHGKIYRSGTSGPWDANPAHVIYECMRERDFGASLPVSRFDVETFELAAQTLYNEGFGVSLKWVQQSKVKEIVSEMLDHIGAVCFEDPRTGLVTLRLLRDDYDESTLRVIDESNARILNFQRKSEELINEVVVTYTNPETFDEATISVQDLAGIATAGSIVSTSRNYYAVRKPELAHDLGERDLRAEGYPLASCEVDLDRSFWKARPGDVYKLTSPDDEADELIMRALKVEDDTGGRDKLKVSLIEDIFALEAAPTLTVPTTLFVDDDGDPLPADAVQILTIPYTLAARAGLSDSETDTFPNVYSVVLVASSQEGAETYDLVSNVVGALGSTTETTLTENSVVSRGQLSELLPAEAESIVPNLSSKTPGDEPVVEGIVMIGTGGDEGMEIAGITALDDDGFTLRRGILDTVPREWPAGTPVWVLDETATVWDTTERAVFEDVEYKVLPRTTSGVLDKTSSPTYTATLGERPYLPFRPANVFVGSADFGQLNLVTPGDVTVSWSNRSRPTEDALFLAWTDPTVTPEIGQTTKITVMDSDRNVLATHEGLIGTTFDIPESSFQGIGSTIVRVTSERDGFESIQGHEIIVIQPVGYGWGYGSNYGGT